MPSTASSLSSTAVMSKTPSPSFVSWVSIAETAASGPTTAMVTSSGSAVTAGHEKASTITAMIAVNPVAMASVRMIGVGRSAPDGDSVVVSDMRSLPSNLRSKNECSFFITHCGLENEHSFLEYNGVMRKVRDAHRAARREEILDAAQRVFARKGYRGSSITGIIDESGLSAGAIYSYFESKHELFHAVVERTLAVRADPLRPGQHAGAADLDYGAPDLGRGRGGAGDAQGPRARVRAARPNALHGVGSVGIGEPLPR